MSSEQGSLYNVAIQICCPCRNPAQKCLSMEVHIQLDEKNKVTLYCPLLETIQAWWLCIQTMRFTDLMQSREVQIVAELVCMKWCCFHISNYQVLSSLSSPCSYKNMFLLSTNCSHNTPTSPSMTQQELLTLVEERQRGPYTWIVSGKQKKGEKSLTRQINSTEAPVYIDE